MSTGRSGTARRSDRVSPIDGSFFARETVEVARSLIGVTLVHGDCAGVIVEAEAYTDDPASHYVTRRPSAGQLMGETWGKVYIYKIYGVHHCLNFTTDAHGPGAVLVRALEPIAGLEVMRERRGPLRERAICSGPGKLTRALAIDSALNRSPILQVFDLRPPEQPVAVDASRRIGISRAKELRWRFTLRGSRFLSRPAPVRRRGTG